jgi:phenylacetate-coenzyme A ligase PaaK-like adenylate-forming protein
LLPEKEIRQQLFNIASEADFNRLCLAVFGFQLRENNVYGDFVKSLKITEAAITHYTQIPFMPVEFFKTQQVVCGKPAENATVFSSSGTTGQITSTHYVTDAGLYKESFLKGFERFYGDVKDYCILALLPSYLERKGSSLVYMFDELIKRSQHSLSGFYLSNINELKTTLNEVQKTPQKVLLLGVTYALLDLAESGIRLTDQVIVMETGGMKGRRKEMIKEEVHEILKSQLGVKAIHSEYGMTELLSQAYSKQDGLFECPPWMKVLVRDANDPFHYVKQGRGGGINVIDLANLYSCSFIETKDLGKIHDGNRFEVLGRFDNSDLRGCNLMIS